MHARDHAVGNGRTENLRNWIVRDTSGHAVLLDGNGVVHAIRDGGCFLQLAHQNLVQDHVLDPYIGLTSTSDFVNRPVGADACT